MKTGIRLFFLLLTALLPTTAAHAQSSQSLWRTLEKVDWEFKYSKVYETEIGFPKFGKEVQALSGKIVTLKAYYIPVDTDDESVVFSAVPYASCFFCGGAGVESVMAVYLQKPKKFKVDDYVTLRGVLYLNDGETGLIYNLRDAVIVPEG